MTADNFAPVSAASESHAGAASPTPKSCMRAMAAYGVHVHSHTPTMSRAMRASFFSICVERKKGYYVPATKEAVRYNIVGDLAII